MYSEVNSGKLTRDVFVEMKIRFFRNMNRLTRAQKRNFLYHLIESSNDIQNITQADKYKLQLELYGLMLKEGLYSRKEGLPMQPITFGNILNCYLELGQAEKAAAFVEAYRSRIPEEFKKSTYYYARAKIFYHLKKYESCIQSVSRVDIKQMPYCYLARALMISAYIELKDAERALYSIDTFAHFLKANPSVTSYHRERFRGFLKYSAKFAKYLSGNDRVNPGAEYLKLKKENRNDYYGYEWLLKKAAELGSIPD
jgi:hypothetical protein